MKCVCNWEGDLQEALLWVIQEGKPAIEGHFELRCPKCNYQLSVANEKKNWVEP